MVTPFRTYPNNHGKSLMLLDNKGYPDRFLIESGFISKINMFLLKKKFNC